MRIWFVGVPCHVIIGVQPTSKGGSTFPMMQFIPFELAITRRAKCKIVKNVEFINCKLCRVIMESVYIVEYLVIELQY